jgi:hypothetical protein
MQVLSPKSFSFTLNDILSLSLSLSQKQRKKMFGRCRPKAAKRSEEIRGKVFGAET